MLKFFGCMLVLCGIGVIWYGIGAWLAPLGIMLGFGFLYLDYLQAKEAADAQTKSK